MFNVIYLSQNHFLDEALTETINNVTHNKLVKSCSPLSVIRTRHVITLNDTDPLNNLLLLAGMTCFADRDIVIILSNLITEKLTRRFIAVKCCLICLPQKSPLDVLKNTLVTRYRMGSENLKVKNDVLLYQKEMKLLLSIHKGVSIQALTEDFCLTEKKNSAYKICIMKKMGLTKKISYYK